MGVRRTTVADEGALSIARALGGMGRSSLLRDALNAPGRLFFDSNSTAVQMAALEGMAFLPNQREAVALLAELLALASTAELREATGNAIVKALQRTE